MTRCVLSALLSFLVALPASARTAAEVKAMLELPASKLKVTGDVVAYMGKTATGPECASFKGAVLDAIAAAAAQSALIDGFVTHLSQSATHTINIKCAKFSGGNSGHTWAVLAGAAINDKTGKATPSCANVATYDDASKCTGDLMAAGDTLIDAWGKFTGTGSGGRDVVIALDSAAGPTAYTTVDLTKAAVSAFTIGASGTLAGNGGAKEVPAAPLAVTVLHELIHAAKIAAGLYSSPKPPAGNVTAADLAAFIENLAAFPAAISVKGKKAADALALLPTSLTLEMLQAYATKSFGETDYEEFQNLLTTGYSFGGKRITENLIRKELGLKSFRNNYK